MCSLPGVVAKSIGALQEFELYERKEKINELDSRFLDMLFEVCVILKSLMSKF